MRGLKARLGIIQLNTAMMDHEFWELAPEGVSIFITRLSEHPPTISGIQDATMQLVECKPTSVLYACTSGSFGPGPEWNDLLIKTMSETAGVPATTNSEAIAEGLKALGARKISVTSPYPGEYEQKLRLFLEAKGFIVTEMKRREVADDYEMSLLRPEVAYQLARETHVRGSDAHLISCAGWRTLPIIQKLENDIGVPVVTSVQAAMWHVLKLSGVSEYRSDMGKLFRLAETPP